MKQACVIIHTDEMHRTNDIPLIEGEEKTKQYRKQNENTYKQDVRRHQQIGKHLFTLQRKCFRTFKS